MGFRGTKIAPATVNSNRKSSREKKTLAQRVNEVGSVTVESKQRACFKAPRPENRLKHKTEGSKV